MSYEKPCMVVVELETEDIVCTSLGLDGKDSGDGSGDWT